MYWTSSAFYSKANFRATSIKTRIETLNGEDISQKPLYFRATSIKTRIETEVQDVFDIKFATIGYQHKGMINRLSIGYYNKDEGIE